VFCALRHGRSLFQLSLFFLSRVLVLDVLAHVLVRARRPPGVAEGQSVHAQRLETYAPVPAGAGVGVESRGWLRDCDLDAQGRSVTQWLTP
jgi:hypothetical protein